jgi:hypothetical protein
MKAIDASKEFQATMKKFYMGKHDGDKCYLAVPSFDCGWYWGFGYVQSRNMHTHLNWLNNGKNQNMFDSIKEFFGDTLVIDDKKLWQLCEIATTIYTLKNAAELFYRGGSNYTKNPNHNKLQDMALCNHINDTLIPLQIFTLWNVLNS